MRPYNFITQAESDVIRHAAMLKLNGYHQSARAVALSITEITEAPKFCVAGGRSILSDEELNQLRGYTYEAPYPSFLIEYIDDVTHDRDIKSIAYVNSFTPTETESLGVTDLSHYAEYGSLAVILLYNVVGNWVIDNTMTVFPKIASIDIKAYCFNWFGHDLDDKTLLGRLLKDVYSDSYDRQAQFYCAYRHAQDHCIALSLKGVTQHVQPAPKMLNKKRKKKGKPLLHEYRTVVIYTPQTKKVQGESQGTKHASPRFHYRRGHLRQYKPGKWAAIPPMYIGNPNLGTIEKTYEIKHTKQKSITHPPKAD